MNSNKIIFGWLAVLTLVLLITLFGGSSKFGGVQYEKWWFNGPVDFASTVNSLVSGTETAIINTSGAWTGVINTALSVTMSGTNTFSGPTTLSASSTIANVASNASSTLLIGVPMGTGKALGAGCLVLGDSGNATSSPVYITASGGTVSATTTKPAICR